MEGVSEDDFIQAGFVRSGDFLIKGELLVWICEDEDCLDRYFHNGKRIRTKKEIDEINGNIHARTS